MPSAILEIIEEGLQLYRRHTNKHKRYAHMNIYVMSRYGLVLLGFIDSWPLELGDSSSVYW
jgi:hypothetical protein